MKVKDHNRNRAASSGSNSAAKPANTATSPADRFLAHKQTKPPYLEVSAHGLKPQSSSLPNRKPCVCIVDDDEDILKVLQTVLQLSKIDSILKTSWNPGDESVLDSVDLALVDMHIGEVSGLKVASEIRSRGFRGPVLAMTASPTLNAPQHSMAWVRTKNQSRLMG